MVLFIKRPETSLAWACRFSPRYKQFTLVPDSGQQLPLTRVFVAPQLQRWPAAVEEPSLLQRSWTHPYPAPNHFERVHHFLASSTNKQRAPTPSQ